MRLVCLAAALLKLALLADAEARGWGQPRILSTQAICGTCLSQTRVSSFLKDGAQRAWLAVTMKCIPILDLMWLAGSVSATRELLRDCA